MILHLAISSVLRIMKLLLSSAALMAFFWLRGTTAARATSPIGVQQNMNPLPYKIANSDAYQADFNQAKYFEVYSPMIRTRYSEVRTDMFWVNIKLT